MSVVDLCPAPAPGFFFRKARETHPPGDLAVWIFILAELLVFAVLLVAYAFARASDRALFDAMQAGLDRRGGAINTVLLISASWCVVRAVRSVNAARLAAAARWLAAAVVGGSGFVLVKLHEYATVFGQGYSLSSDRFHMFYIGLTFFHFMHVLLGLAVLVVLLLQTRRGAYRSGHMNGLESGAAYWHMVDLVWIVLFPLVYVLR
ncbi:cytochrome c oxidase subunit 3 [Niveibacterium sp. COAC-50]|uniref:cytochrome c oxidase subunit 3 n=1 Tax=Niveibacterium sp. COAC-50 TaxID=2729384 RepID=UPI001558091C|nr:cytochrome c oxidase subunit 3 [Niveibacterium sp. COAC-50]